MKLIDENSSKSNRADRWKLGEYDSNVSKNRDEPQIEYFWRNYSWSRSYLMVKIHRELNQIIRSQSIENQTNRWMETFQGWTKLSDDWLTYAVSISWWHLVDLFDSIRCQWVFIHRFGHDYSKFIGIKSNRIGR